MNPAFLNTRIACCLVSMLVSSGVFAAGQVSSVMISEQPATPFSYSVDGIEYNWGGGNNQLLDGFTADGRNYDYALAANEVLVQRDDIAGVASGEPCGIFVERLALDEFSRTFAADFPSDGSELNNCQLSQLLGSRIINRGVVDVFSNTVPDAKNIERLDYMFYFGAMAPLSEDQLRLAGHLVAEKSGNNPVKVAAILSVDVFGQPAEYGPLVLVSEAGCSAPAICYGATDLVQDYSFLQNDFNAPQSLPAETERSVEALNMAFVSTADLGLSLGQRYFGVSFFGDDVDAGLHDLSDPGTFPDNTSDDYIVVGDDADIYGGLSGYYLADELNVASGSLFLDIDLDGIPDNDEAGISDISLSLFVDVNGDGLIDPATDSQLGDDLLSNTDGSFVFPGLPDGNYVVVLDEDDPQIPAGLIVAPGTNPVVLTIGGADSGPVDYAFISDSDTGSGSQNDGADDGGTDDGGTDDGGTDDGGTDDGGTDDGGTDDGGTDDGGTDDGGADDGGTDDGGADDGGADDGGTDDGGTDDGGTDDGGTDDGGTDDGGADDGGTDDGGTDDGGTDDGGTDDGGTDDGGTDDGGTDDGGTDDGGTDDGGTDDGGADDGGGPNDDDTLQDDATAANSDDFNVLQGQPVSLNVLANDFDGAGGGLTLVSVSESSNAQISITADNQVLYVPNYGYYSPENNPDTFTYTMSDTDGTTRTGNVSVNVMRSDLDGNMIDDFIDCGCDELYLETGINGSGIGNVSMFALFALTLVMLWRLFATESIVQVFRKGGA